VVTPPSERPAIPPIQAPGSADGAGVDGVRVLGGAVVASVQVNRPAEDPRVLVEAGHVGIDDADDVGWFAAVGPARCRRS
jgi:hypothetical protein